jgi:hypothetical protein
MADQGLLTTFRDKLGGQQKLGALVAGNARVGMGVDAIHHVLRQPEPCDDWPEGRKTLHRRTVRGNRTGSAVRLVFTEPPGSFFHRLSLSQQSI